ncbi:hypothetical protein GJ744_003230 [Endocarpon pusillum]|uniref:Cyclin N-terminal domain-containing protein n=1 Tax=Endocarpon pusillum TaxID=364733 RepID=A0A8H7AEN9_9EURO|nr:hypothetical protein GJ744_003230 [Endocarpon pusillum]
MGTLFAHQSMPHQKRAPVGYFEYSLNNQLTCSESQRKDAIGSATSATIDTFSDSSSQLSWKPTASQSSTQTTPESIRSYGNASQAGIACLGVLQEPVPSVDVPSWREGVEKESQAPGFILPTSQRQNCRRTGLSSRGADTRHISPPPTLVRQPERRQCFVSSLVIFAAGLIAAVWPLSAPVLHDTSYAHNVLPLQDFITETLRRSKTSYSTLQVAMYYLILLKAHLPKCDFTQEQSCLPTDRRAMQCGRRMFLSALMLASKFLQDRNYSTRAWGKITGLPTSEINTNELKFLEAVNWKLHVSKEKFERWSHAVIALSSPPRPGISPTPQPSLVETVGWSAVLERLTPDSLDDFSQFRNGSAMLKTPCYQADLNGMLTPPTSPPESTTADQEEPSHGPEVKDDAFPIAASNEVTCTYPILPPAPCQQNLPTPRSTPRLSESLSSSRAARGTARCPESSSALAMLKLCARPANRTLCPPPTQRPCPRADAASRPSISRRSSISSSTSDSSSPESVRSDLSGFPGRSRSSSISSVASSVLASFQSANTLDLVTHDAQLPCRLQQDINPSKVDCSSTLRPEEYSAADALLRFHKFGQREANKGQASQPVSDSMQTDLTQFSNHRLTGCTSYREKKKKRTHSKTNISDLLNIPEDDLQSLVRKELMTSGGEVEPIVTSDDDAANNTLGRQCKRNRPIKGQSSAVDHTRILMKEKNKEKRTFSSKCRSSHSENRQALAGFAGRA